nr:hypothetical protein Itr_chr14CG12940 [Ipomoea trifida]
MATACGCEAGWCTVGWLVAAEGCVTDGRAVSSAVLADGAGAGTAERPGSVITCGSSWAKTCGIRATAGGAVADRAATSADAVADWAATSADAVADWPATIEAAGADWAATAKAAGATSVVRGSAKSCVGSADCSGARTSDSGKFQGTSEHSFANSIILRESFIDKSSIREGLRAKVSAIFAQAAGLKSEIP